MRGYNKKETKFLVEGFTHGFKIPYEGEEGPLLAQNSPSTQQNPQAVQANIDKELLAGRIAGPFKEPPFPNFKSSPIGLIPKKDPGHYRTIHNLSYPYRSGSVNHGISHANSTVQYASFNQAINILNTLPSGAFLAKSDIRSAFRLLPIHPQSYHLLGFSWEGQYYYDKCLPFGLASSCQIFERFSTALQWILQHKLGVKYVTHLLDDFLFMGVTYRDCSRSLNTFLSLSEYLGIPIAHDKTVLPTHELTYLGITINTRSRQTSLPPDKVLKASSLIHEALDFSHLTLRQLQSLIGTLNFACAVITPGRPFLRKLIDLTKGVSGSKYRIPLTTETKNDLLIWDEFLTSFNGKALILYQEPILDSTLNLYTDAAQSVGFGATFASHWFQHRWPSGWQSFHISVLELYPIFVALSTWAPLLANHTIILHSDNTAVVHVLNSRTAKDAQLLHLIRKITLISLSHNVNYRAVHIPGKSNLLADALSRFQECPMQFALVKMDQSPTQISSQLLPSNFIWPPQPTAS